jgi:MEMO1 family protein
MKGPVRKPVIAGSWYTDDPRALRSEITGFLEKAEISGIPRKPIAIISPHAGYMFSGKVAAHAYKAVSGHTYSAVAVISPSHRAYFPYVSIWAKGSFETPLGILEVDEPLCGKLMEASVIFTDNTKPHSAEHALEIQLPFLQAVLPPFKLCPLIMGRQDPDLCLELSNALQASIKNPDDVLIVASSDLSHFHPGKQAEEMDALVARHIEEFDIEGLSRDIETSKCEACGSGPIMTALSYAKSLSRTGVKILKYAHSGHITGDNSSVVGYLSAVIY